jgi:Icc protein
VIDRYPQVRLVIFGHIHQEFERSRRGITYLGTPSTCIQFMPNSQKFSLDQTKPGFRLLNLYPNGMFNTKIERVAYTHQLDTTAMGY